MSTAESRSLRPKESPGLSNRFFRVGRSAQKWSAARGLGVVFATCWNGERTMLHAGDYECPNCSEQVTPGPRRRQPGPSAKRRPEPFNQDLYDSLHRIGSLHAVRDLSTTSFGNLFLPDLPTRALLAFAPADLDNKLITMYTRRRGVGSGSIDVELEVRDRRVDVDPVVVTRVLSHLSRVVLRHFRGQIHEIDALTHVHSWPVEEIVIA